MKYILSSIIFLGLISCNSQKKLNQYIVLTNVQDSMFYFRQMKFQKWTDSFEKGKVFSFKNEEYTDFEIFNTKEKAIEYAKQIISAKYPFIINSKVELKFNISENDNKKIWFVNVDIKNTGQLYLIFFKGNGKVIFHLLHA